ncbi:MarR family winged helix-turn-helix transcriptional regulator [Crossiella cryophila]|uniref:DNA-binding MarR family transcriptional regulator n=1 Tax=Crossiella cryophila TaxID=43355 RepID=A0A7W7C8H5_9PSEU|nr:MarR family transcriptional regulator [Crossiella cryophila]MBB4676451.1 DNA-binding MarR family transcriptional regulator [Crossiella cryophila]
MRARKGLEEVISATERDRLVEELGVVRRELIGEMLINLSRSTGGADLQLVQIATLFTLDRGSEPTVRELAERIGRSVSATSRLLDQLAQRGLIHRREDESDRRAKRVGLTEAGTRFLLGVARSRAEGQLRLMTYLSETEQRTVREAMTLLADAARRHGDEHR